MSRVPLLFALLAAALAVSPPVQAAGTLTRTFVSSTGSDSNPCNVAQPCATFAAAYNAVAANGIVAALDPGKYGPLAITGPVTIDGNGWAAITAPTNGNAGINVTAGTTDHVILRGLTVDGAGVANTTGIESTSIGSLTVDGCVVRNVAGNGLEFAALAFTSTAQALAVSNSAFIDNGGHGLEITLSPLLSGTTSQTVSIEGSAFNHNGGDGVHVFGPTATSTGPLTAAVTGSVAANNATAGFVVESSSNQSVTLTLTGSLAVGNPIGIEATGAQATLWLARSTIAGNANAGFSIPIQGIIATFGNNYFADNGTNTGTLTPVATQ